VCNSVSIVYEGATLTVFQVHLGEWSLWPAHYGVVGEEARDSCGRLPAVPLREQVDVGTFPEAILKLL
jgi:hypothetical protein